MLSSEDEEITDPPGVTPLVVVPCNELDEVFVQLNSSSGVKDAGGGMADEVGGHDRILRVFENAFERSICGLLDGDLDLLVARFFFQAHNEINNGDIESRDTEGKPTAN